MGGVGATPFCVSGAAAAGCVGPSAPFWVSEAEGCVEVSAAAAAGGDGATPFCASAAKGGVECCAAGVA